MLLSFRVMFLALVALTQLLQGVAQTTSFAGTLTTDNFVTGATPTGLSLTSHFTNGISSVGNTIVLTVSKALFTGSATVTVGVTGGAGSPTWSAITTNVAGTEITLTLSGGSVNAGETLTFAISDQFVALPATGVVTLTATSTGDTAGAPVAIFYIMATPSISLTSTNLNIPTVPSQLDISFIVPFELNAGETIVLTSSHHIFAVLQTTGLTTSGVTAATYTTSNTPGQTFTITLAAPSYAVGQSVTLTLASPLLAQFPTVGAVTIDLILNSITAWNDAAGFGTITNPGVAGNDPIARYGDVVRMFELPPAVLTPLLSTPFITVQGSVFEGGGPWEQWFNRIVLTLPEQEQSSGQGRFIEIKTKANLQDVSFTDVADGEFSTLDITLGYGDVSAPSATAPVQAMGTDIPRGFLGHQIIFRSVQQTGLKMMPRECADVAGPAVHFYICSSPATEYWGPLGHLALQYAHLDLAFIEVQNITSLTGLLPELWGTQPMTETTKQYVKDNASAASNPKTVASDHSATTAWAGGIGMEDIHKGCLDKTQHDSVVTV